MVLTPKAYKGQRKRGGPQMSLGLATLKLSIPYKLKLGH